MSRWSDIAAWRGPTVNQSGAMREQRGVVVHIAEGTYEGTISWQRNPDANVSSHFIVAKDGRIAQMVDTDVTAWTQSAGNGHWLSVENEGFTPNALTAQQVEANAKILAKAHQVYGVPLQLAVNPDGKGLGHHSMGCNWPGGAWGHCDCPGPAIIAQKPEILTRAISFVTGVDMAAIDEIKFLCDQTGWDLWDLFVDMNDVQSGGPHKGRKLKFTPFIKALAATVNNIDTKVSALAGPVITDAQLARLADLMLAKMPKPLSADDVRAIVRAEIDSVRYAPQRTGL